MASTTAWTALRSASPEYVGGVPTATNSSSRALERVGQLRREVHPLAVLRDDLREARLVDGDLAALQAIDLVHVDVDADDLGPELRETGGGDESDVAGADHADRCALLAHEAGEVS